MSSSVTIDGGDLIKIAEREGVCSMRLLEQASEDGIIVEARGYDRRETGPEFFQLAGSKEDFKVYVERLSVRLGYEGVDT